MKNYIKNIKCKATNFVKSYWWAVDILEIEMD